MEAARKLLPELEIPGDAVIGPQELRTSVCRFLNDKLLELLRFMEDVGVFLQRRERELFPPGPGGEVLRQWANLGLAVGLPIVLLTISVCCCCSRWGGFSGGGRKMKGAGKMGRFKVSRRFFMIREPWDYVRNLRQPKKDMLF
ncbi:hypothetical protein AXF42_Ash004260 [Apostasia shenzhenica]|uniref:Uncharacterized protein n=1 Tax=Apostasia shenzhenica TaxID=1088818 RepID=A0A2I0A2F3_9ASPA|nr:hypothetical protein AXF42_Ash004260 [Apostasia shenzhenica]